MPATVRISDHSRSLLGKLATENGSTMTDILDAALENYRRLRFLDQANRSYAALAEDSGNAKLFRDELAAFDPALEDGLGGYAE